LYHTIDFGTIAVVKTFPIYDWSVEKYIALVEKGSHPIISSYERAELDYLRTQVKNPQDKTFIDVGAGYGRVLPHIAPPQNSKYHRS